MRPDLGIPQIEEAVKQMGISGRIWISSATRCPPPSARICQRRRTTSGQSDRYLPLLNQLFSGSDRRRDLPEKQNKEREKGAPQAKNQKAQIPGHLLPEPHRPCPGGKAGPGGGPGHGDRQVIQILNRRQKNNPCLIGEPGVGKTAIAEGLAQRIAQGEVPFKLRDKEVYLLDLTALVAGTQFRGQFESRMKSLIAEVKACGNIISW